MAWRVARSLDTLLAQLNAAAPRRSKVSDGSIGDAAHASRNSDHNPWYGPGIVTARDFTHDPAGGLDCHTLANSLVASKDPRIKYVIWHRRILSGAGGPSPWRWRNYSGSNPHTKHLHLSVVASPACDDTRPWTVGTQGPTPGGFLMTLSPQEQRTLYNRVMGFNHQRWYVLRNGKPVEVGQGAAGAIPAHALDTLDGNYLVNRILDVHAEVVAVKAAQTAPVPVEIDYDRLIEGVVAKLGALTFDAE